MQHDDENDERQQRSRASALAVNTALPGVRSVHDTLAPYERATGFAASTSCKAHPPIPVQLTDAAAPPIGSGALADRWRTHVAELLETANEASRVTGTGEPDHNVDHLSDYVQRVLALTGAPTPSAPPLSRTPSTPSSDMMDLTSDSGSLDDDTASSLQSPPPASPSMPTSGKKIPGGRVPRPGSAGGGAGAPRIRRASTASLPGTSFSSPSVSPSPPEQLLSFPSSLSLDLDYESHDSESSQEQQQQQSHMDRRARKQRTTRDLVDQARQQRARETEDGVSSADRRSPESEQRSAMTTTTTTTTGPTFVHPPRAPTALPRCSADIKADEDEWWLGMDLVQPSGMFHHWANGLGGDFVPRTPRLHESSMPFRFGSSSSSTSSSPSRGLSGAGPGHPHQHPHQHHPHPHQHHSGHPGHQPPPQLTSSEDFPALPSSPPRSEPPKSQPPRKWHKKAKSKSATGIPTILEADEEGPARASAAMGVGATGKRSVSGSSAGSSVAGVPTKSTSPVSGYHQQMQPPPMPPMSVAYAQQHAGMQGTAAYPPAVPPGFAFAAHGGFSGAGHYGFPSGPPPSQQQQQPQIPSFAQAQGAFGPTAAQLFSMQQQQQQQGYGARPPGFGAAPMPGPPPGLRAGFAPGPPPHAVMGMYAPHTVYATAQPVGAYYSSR